MTEEYQISGKTTIATDVLVTIAKLTTLNVDGVSRLAPLPSGVDWLFNKGVSEGVKITVENDSVYTDLFCCFKR